MKNGTPLWRKAHLEVKMLKTDGVGALFEVLMSKNCTPLWREAHLQVKMHKTPQSWTTFGSFDPAKLHAAVARSTFASKNARNTSLSEPFLMFQSGKIARRCGAKQICKSKCAKHHILGPLLEVKMFKNGTPLWREVHF